MARYSVKENKIYGGYDYRGHHIHYFNGVWGVYATSGEPDWYNPESFGCCFEEAIDIVDAAIDG